MKKMQLTLFLLIGLTGATMAQQKNIVTVVVKTPTVQCEQCKQRIENYMSHEDGIIKVDVDFKKKITTVKYMADRTNVENIKADIARKITYLPDKQRLYIWGRICTCSIDW